MTTTRTITAFAAAAALVLGLTACEKAEDSLSTRTVTTPQGNVLCVVAVEDGDADAIEALDCDWAGARR